MEQATVTEILQLIKGLGAGGLWVIVFVYVIQLIKTIIGWSFILWGLRLVTSLILSIAKYSLEKDNEQEE